MTGHVVGAVTRLDTDGAALGARCVPLSEPTKADPWPTA
jgi:hypothetical protein